MTHSWATERLWAEMANAVERGGHWLASAIEAQRATTPKSGAVEDESAMAKPDAPNAPTDPSGIVVMDDDAELRRFRTAVLLVLQNSEGCAANHYGDDYQGVMPGWLIDCRRDIEAGLKRLVSKPDGLREALEQIKAECADTVSRGTNKRIDRIYDIAAAALLPQAKGDAE